jgi:hypothetical protein
MIYIQAEESFGKFQELTELEQNGWKLKEPVVTEPKKPAKVCSFEWEDHSFCTM